ncbi:MAG: ATP-binding cassette domain-containing protein [Eggerthellaceae bacterium]
MRKPAVILRGIRKSFPVKNVLDGLFLTVDEGDLFGIIGPKGSGKTSILKVIMGLSRIQSGKVIFGPQYGGGLANGRAACASVISEPFIPGIAIARYLQKIPFFQKPEVWEKAQASFEIAGFEKQHKRYRDLTILEKRRFAIALALMKEPKILLLDQPFDGLSEDEATQLGCLLENLNREHGITIIFTAEELRQALKAAKRVAFVEHGTASRAQDVCELEEIGTIK